jgi:hypothetical protein
MFKSYVSYVLKKIKCVTQNTEGYKKKSRIAAGLFLNDSIYRKVILFLKIAHKRRVPLRQCPKEKRLFATKRRSFRTCHFEMWSATLFAALICQNIKAFDYVIEWSQK